jgi:hypothetical protein
MPTGLPNLFTPLAVSSLSKKRETRYQGRTRRGAESGQVNFAEVEKL